MIRGKRPASRLYYLVGASGSGKDSILRHFRENCMKRNDKPVAIAHRYITRISDSTENAIALSHQEFEERLQRQCFALHWQANSYRYGIGIEINMWLKSGLSVIVNGSRAHLETAKLAYPKHLHSISVDVSDDVLQQRLQRRNRETDGEIQLRMQRHRRLKPAYSTDSVITNNSSLDHATQQLVSILHQ